MTEWPIPRTVRELRGFLRLTGCYRKFVKDYGKIARGLTELLKKDGFRWTDEATTSFRRLQEVMTKVPVLALRDFTKPFTLETDASGHGVGAVMMQDGRPIAYFSQALGPRAQMKSVYERELMDIVMAIQKWRPYLLGRKFTVITDQKSLKFLLEQRAIPGEHQKWVAKLSGYDFEIIYRPGKENGVADALSRRGDHGSLNILTPTSVKIPEDMKQKLASDPEIVALKDRLAIGDEKLQCYTIDQGLAYYHGRLVLPRTSKWVSQIVREFHTGATGGHEGGQKTYQRVAREFYWIGMRRDVAREVAECDVC